MAQREGSLEAPTRHPIDWQNPEFYDEAACEKEMARIFDICHGCRRCVSLCQSFPTLFDLVDATEDGELHGVDVMTEPFPGFFYISFFVNSLINFYCFYLVIESRYFYFINSSYFFTSN